MMPQDCPCELPPLVHSCLKLASSLLPSTLLLYPRAPSVRLCTYAGPTSYRFVCVQDKRAIICTPPTFSLILCMNFLGLYCEEHSPTRIVSALHHHIPCFTRVDGLVVSLPLKNSWVRVSCTAAPPYRRYLKQNSGLGIAFGIRSSLPQATSHVWSSVDASGLQALHHEAHGMLSSPCKARWAWSSRRQQPSIHGQRRHVYGSKSCEVRLALQHHMHCFIG